MGITYFTTFVYEYLLANGKRAKLLINLSKQNVIIDGFSLFYFTYYKIKREDADKPEAEQITTEKLAYNGLSEKFREILKHFKESCANLKVVFDGNVESNPYRRDDPKRDSSIKFDNNRTRLPPLLHALLMNILHELDITVRIAPGEADPYIVQMARAEGAYIIARDSDYFLYGATKGYISLDSLEFATLQGECYRMRDVFEDMLQRGVALWATTIIYKFIDLDVLEKDFEVKNASDAEQFRHWLALSQSDHDKSQRLKCQYNLLRYIQQVGHIKAYNKLMALVREEDRDLFEQLIDNYTNIPFPTPKLTFNGNEIHSYLSTMYFAGKLDSDVLNILVRRRVSTMTNQHNETYCRVLLPMCYMLIQWDNSTSTNPTQSSTIAFNQKRYDILAEFKDSNLPSLDELIGLEKKQKNFVLACIDFALPAPLNWKGVHKDYKLWLCILKLWLQTRAESSEHSKATLLALIISFFKHALLDTHTETEGRSRRSDALLEQPYLQHSITRLKSFFSREQCYDLREGIKRYAQTHVPRVQLSNTEIDLEVRECEQFYKAVSMINQFAGKPLYMPPVDFSFNQLTLMLAVRISQPNRFLKKIAMLCSENKILANVILESYDFLLYRK